MTEAAELDTRIARLEAALDATSRALQARRQAVPASDPEHESAAAELAAARERIGSLEAALAEARKRSDPGPQDGAAGSDGAASSQTDGSGSDEVASLRAELSDLRAARAMDLAEMKALLAELEPMLESADA